MTLEIKLPATIGRNQTSEVLKRIQPIFIQNDYDEVLLDLSSVSWIEPIGLTAVASAITFAKEQRGAKIKIIPSRSIWSYFERMGFLKRMMDRGKELEPSSINRGLVELGNMVKLNQESEVERKTTHLSDFLTQDVSYAEIKENTKYVITEVFNNVFNHSSSPFGCFYCGQRWYNRPYIQIAIADCGIGIKNSLNNCGKYGIFESDIKAIKKALEPEVSGCFPSPTYANGRTNAGYGLTISRQTIISNIGDLMIVSGNGYYLEGASGRIARTMDYYWQGTIIMLQLYTGNINKHYREILDELVPINKDLNIFQ